MHRNHRTRRWRQRSLHLCHTGRERCGVHVDKDRRRPFAHHAVGHRGPGEGGQDDLVAGPQIQRHQRQMHRRRTARAGHHFGTKESGRQRLRLCHHLALNQHPRSKHLGDPLQIARLKVGVAESNHAPFRYQATVRSMPARRSTSGAKPSSARARSMLGMRTSISG